MTKSTEAVAPFESAAEIEKQIAEINAKLVEIAAAEPQSEAELAKLQSSREWCELPRSKLIARRFEIEKAIALERSSEIQAAYNRSGDP